jgi:hypothetical protein
LLYFPNALSICPSPPPLLPSLSSAIGNTAPHLLCRRRIAITRYLRHFQHRSSCIVLSVSIILQNRRCVRCFESIAWGSVGWVEYGNIYSLVYCFPCRRCCCCRSTVAPNVFCCTCCLAVFDTQQTSLATCSLVC